MWCAEIWDYQQFLFYFPWWEFCAKLCCKHTFWCLSISTNMISFSLWLYLLWRITRKNTVPWNSNLMVDLMDLFTAQLVFSLYCKDLFLLERKLHRHRWTIIWILINVQCHHVNFTWVSTDSAQHSIWGTLWGKKNLQSWSLGPTNWDAHVLEIVEIFNF